MNLCTQHSLSISIILNVINISLCCRCTDWKHILANNTGHYKEKARDWESIHTDKRFASLYNVKLLANFNKSEIYKRLEYFTFMVVRNPLDRIISAYTDKFVNTKSQTNFYRNFHGKRILKLFSSNATKEQLASGKGVTFEQFVKYIDKHMDDHWSSIQSICHPCINRIDYIINLEASATDREYIIANKLSGYGARSGVGVRHRVGRGAQMESSLPEYKDISGRMFKKLLGQYRSDLAMFGYTFERKQGVVFTQCGSRVNNQLCC